MENQIFVACFETGLENQSYENRDKRSRKCYGLQRHEYDTNFKCRIKENLIVFRLNKLVVRAQSAILNRHMHRSNSKVENNTTYRRNQ